MAIDLTGFRADTTALLVLWGETVTPKRLSIDYAAVPPTETWTAAATFSMEIQPISGSMFRGDPGLISGATHWGFAAYNAGVLVDDRIIRTAYAPADTNYYLVTRVDDLEDHLEVWMKCVAGAV